MASHQRSARDTQSGLNERLQREFEVLLDAVTPHAIDQGMPLGEPQRWRSQGWSEIAGFLADMHYSFDAAVAERASAAAKDRIGQCRDVLLPPADFS